MKKTQRGFTLVELLVVIGIIGIVTSALFGIRNITKDLTIVGKEGTKVLYQELNSAFKSSKDNKIKEIDDEIYAFKSIDITISGGNMSTNTSYVSNSKIIIEHKNLINENKLIAKNNIKNLKKYEFQIQCSGECRTISYFNKQENTLNGFFLQIPIEEGSQTHGGGGGGGEGGDEQGCQITKNPNCSSFLAFIGMCSYYINSCQPNLGFFEYLFTNPTTNINQACDGVGSTVCVIQFDEGNLPEDEINPVFLQKINNYAILIQAKEKSDQERSNIGILKFNDITSLIDVERCSENTNTCDNFGN